MISRSRPLLILPACLGLFVAHAAHADPSATELAGARHAFESAVSLEADQHWADAALKLREAIVIKDTPGLRFHLAHCEAEQGFLVAASLDYDRASELLRQGAKAPDVQKLLEPASAELKRRIPRLTVEIPSDLSAVAELDGKPCAPSELLEGQPLDPGRHQLKVSAAGHLPFERALSVREGEAIAIRAELPLSSPSAAPAAGPLAVAGASSAPGAPSSPAAASANASPRENAVPAGAAGARSSAKLYLLLGESALTVAGLALGVGYALAESSAADRIASSQSQIDHAAQGNPAACTLPATSIASSCADLRSAIDDHDQAGKWSTIGFAGAGVGAAALITTWLVYPQAETAARGPMLQPVVAIGRIGLAGRF